MYKWTLEASRALLIGTAVRSSWYVLYINARKLDVRCPTNAYRGPCRGTNGLWGTVSIEQHVIDNTVHQREFPARDFLGLLRSIRLQLTLVLPYHDG